MAIKNLNAFTDEEKWRAKISAYLSTNLVLSGTEQVLAFDVVSSSRDITGLAGIFTIQTEGFYSGGINLNANITGFSSIVVWVECKPFGGAWGLCGSSMLRIAGLDDFSGNIPLNSGFDFGVGDEIRIMIKKISGTVSLVSSSETVTLGTIVQPSAAINFMRSDNII